MKYTPWNPCLDRFILGPYAGGFNITGSLCGRFLSNSLCRSHLGRVARVAGFLAITCGWVNTHCISISSYFGVSPGYLIFELHVLPIASYSHMIEFWGPNQLPRPGRIYGPLGFTSLDSAECDPGRGLGPCNIHLGLKKGGIPIRWSFNREHMGKWLTNGFKGTRFSDTLLDVKTGV